MSRRHSATEVYHRVERYWQTLRYLRPSQIAARIDLRTRSAMRRLRPAAARHRYDGRAARVGLTWSGDPWSLRGSGTGARRELSSTATAALEEESRAVASGTFTFLNDTRHLGRPVDWRAQDASQLWRYHLHYFDYLPDLLLADAAPAALSLMEEWRDRVPMADASSRDAWHPYVVSLRVVNWMLALAALPRTVEPSGPIIDSLAVQTVFVERNLETDVGGNHLLKNLKALAIAGCFWDGAHASALQSRFTGEFVRALQLQLRTDGGHYEQSPMYHAQVLTDAIELAAVLRHRGISVPDLDSAIETMGRFLRHVCHPDGELVQFGDTARGMVADPAELLAAAALLRNQAAAAGLTARHALLLAPLSHHRDRPDTVTAAAAPLPAGATLEPDASGFVVLATARAPGFLIADAGPVCPDDLPAHAHSDLFGFEVSVGRTRMVVDSGISEYTAGRWREYFRSTGAHSTVVVDDEEQSECWGSFRVGRRARVVEARLEEGRRLRGFSAAHTGFSHLPQPVLHRRHFLVVDERAWLIIDELHGEGTHRWATFLHLHPEVALSQMEDSKLVASRDAAPLAIAWFGVNAPRCISGQTDPLQGWHAPAFGRVAPSPTLAAEGGGTLPACFGWLLVPGEGARHRFGVERSTCGRIEVRLDDDTFDVALDQMR